MNIETQDLLFKNQRMILCRMQGWGKEWDPSHQYAEELSELLSTQAFLKRKQDFVAGRLCAKKALEGFSFATTGFLPRADSGEAIFPPGFSGSISHTASAAVALVVQGVYFQSVGVDIETFMNPKVWEKIKNSIISKDEGQIIQDIETHSEHILGTLLFSAKETLYKGIHPLVRTFFSFDAFECTEIDFAQQICTFRAQEKLESMFGSSTVQVVFNIEDDKVLTYTGILVE